MPDELSSEWRPIPYLQSDAMPGARRMPPAREKVFLQGLIERSKAIEEKDFVSQSWERFCREQQHSFMSATLGHGRVLGQPDSQVRPEVPTDAGDQDVHHAPPS